MWCQRRLRPTVAPIAALLVSALLAVALVAPLHSMGRATRYYGPLFAILFLGACLRIYQLGTESLWFDETFAVSLAKESLSRIVEQSEIDNNFPTYYLLLHYWVALFGDSESSVRLPSALAGVLAPFVMYKVGHLLFDRSTGLMASLIMALSLFHIAFSQEARVYSLMTLLALLSFYFFIKVLRERELAAQLGYVICTSALMYSHVYGLFIVLAQNTYVATVFLRSAFGWQKKAGLGLGRWILLQALLFTLYIPGIVLLAGWVFDPANGARINRAWMQPPSLESIYEALVTYSGSPQLLILFLVFSLLAVVKMARSGAGSKLYLVLLWLLTPVALPLVISSLFTPMFVTKHAIAATPALYLLAAKGVDVASRASFRAFSRVIPCVLASNAAWWATSAALILLSLGGIWGYFNTVDKAQWREAAQYVDSHAQTGDLVLIAPPHEYLAFQHYSERTDIEKYQVPHTLMERDTLRSLMLQIQQKDRVWAVQDRGVSNTLFDSSQPNEFFSSGFFKESYTPIRHEQYTGPDVTLYENRLLRER